MAQAARRVRNASEAAQARAAAIARELTGRHGWAVGEAGLDGFAARNLGEHIRRRPRDPFPRLANAAIRVAGETANDLVRDANAAVAAVRLVPADAAYEGFRARGLVLASALAADACSKEWFEDARHAYPTASAAAMVRIVRTRLRHPDPTHAGQYELARALNLAGRHGEALNAASAATRLHGTPGFAYDYTCLLSLDGQTRLALDWLRFAMARGYGNVQWARQDPDLERLRREQASGFADLTQVKFRWQIVWGVFNDDIRVTNDSAFALTNVTLSPDIRQGARTWNPPLRVARLEPGASHTWSNVVAIPGRRTDVARASLTADQTPR